MEQSKMIIKRNLLFWGKYGVQIVKDSTLFNIYNSEKIFVNSFHHQAVSVPGNKLRCGRESGECEYGN